MPSREVLSKSRNVVHLARAPNKTVLDVVVSKNTQVITREMDDMHERVVSELKRKMKKDDNVQVAGLNQFKDHKTFNNENTRDELQIISVCNGAEF